MSTGPGVSHQELDEKEQITHINPASISDPDIDIHSPQRTRKNQDDTILSLACEFTAQSHLSHHESPFQASKGSPLDPNSPTFNARAWAKAFYALRYNSSVPARVSGIAFRHLTVSGTGSPTDFQSSVANFFLKLPSLFGRGARKIDILRDLDGLVRPGEQCCVLGPPGSGCSTLLKTIAGETHGFEVGKDAYVNYQGVRAERMHGEFRGEAVYTAEVDRHFAQLGVGDTLFFAA